MAEKLEPQFQRDECTQRDMGTLTMSHHLLAGSNFPRTRAISILKDLVETAERRLAQLEQRGT